MRDRRAELDGEVVAISFAPIEALRPWRDDLGLPFPALVDADRAAYRAYGLERASVARVWLSPKVWRAYARLLLRGEHFRPIRQDSLQLGGDVVVAPDGTIAWAYRSAGPEDRPGVARLAAEMQRAARAGVGGHERGESDGD